MVKGFSKMYNFLFFGQFFFCKHFYYKTGFCKKKFNFCKFANFFADSRSRAQKLSNDVSFVIFGHQIWDLELTPPQRILVFKYLSRDRVKEQWLWTGVTKTGYTVIPSQFQNDQTNFSAVLSVFDVYLYSTSCACSSLILVCVAVYMVNYGVSC